MLSEIWSQLTLSSGFLLAVALFLAFAFETANGFHDTANAVATVIYTRSLRPSTAVIWSGLCNMAGIFLGGIAVAYSIVHLLPVDLLINIHQVAGLTMVLSLLMSALVWNVGTWYLGLPASSSHALIGSILGVGMANALYHGNAISQGINLKTLSNIGITLMISPLLGFGLSAILVFLIRTTPLRRKLDIAPKGDTRPPLWVRGLLCVTCTGVSLAHGSNDGQKGMGLIMLILIGILPAQFALNLENQNQYQVAMESAQRIDKVLDRVYVAHNGRHPGDSHITLVSAAEAEVSPDYLKAKDLLKVVNTKLSGRHSFRDLSPDERMELRSELIELDGSLKHVQDYAAATLGSPVVSQLNSLRGSLKSTIEYVPFWVVVAVALALGFGTMVGWQRIVVTVGEKIGQSHLTYGQGASAELVAMTTIGIADLSGLPVSTTHVLSSGVAGTMWANRSGVNKRTMTSILLAWVLTLPATMLLSGAMFFLSRLLFH